MEPGPELQQGKQKPDKREARRERHSGRAMLCISGPSALGSHPCDCLLPWASGPSVTVSVCQPVTWSTWIPARDEGMGGDLGVLACAGGRGPCGGGRRGRGYLVVRCGYLVFRRGYLVFRRGNPICSRGQPLFSFSQPASSRSKNTVFQGWSNSRAILPTFTS